LKQCASGRCCQKSISGEATLLLELDNRGTRCGTVGTINDSAWRKQPHLDEAALKAPMLIYRTARLLIRGSAVGSKFAQQDIAAPTIQRCNARLCPLRDIRWSRGAVLQTTIIHKFPIVGYRL
jgi:hypothetical protein